MFSLYPSEGTNNMASVSVLTELRDFLGSLNYLIPIHRIRFRFRSYCFGLCVSKVALDSVALCCGNKRVQSFGNRALLGTNSGYKTTLSLMATLARWQLLSNLFQFSLFNKVKKRTGKRRK